MKRVFTLLAALLVVTSLSVGCSKEPGGTTTESNTTMPEGSASPAEEPKSEAPKTDAAAPAENPPAENPPAENPPANQ